MPVSKKPRRKTATRAAPAPRETSELPDGRVMEGYLAAFGGRSRNDAIAQAQDVMYQAWEATNRRQRMALAHKALSISPLCADAYNLLAEEAGNAEEARALYARGMEAGELALGRKGFREYEGHFWGFLETRPYMRARAGLAMTLLRLGEEDAAIEHFRAMLKLNPVIIRASAVCCLPACSSATTYKPSRRCCRLMPMRGAPIGSTPEP